MSIYSSLISETWYNYTRINYDPSYDMDTILYILPCSFSLFELGGRQDDHSDNTLAAMANKGQLVQWL